MLQGRLAMCTLLIKKQILYYAQDDNYAENQ